MSKKLYFLISFVLVLCLSGQVEATAFSDPNFNLSFELDKDGNQIVGHRDDLTKHALNWRNDHDFAGVDVYCPFATGTPHHCHDWEASDGIAYCFIQHDNVYAYQAFDPNIDANSIIAKDRLYSLTFDALTEASSASVIIASFYYLEDFCNPDVNHFEITSKSYVLPAPVGPESEWEWTYDLTLQFVSEAGGAYNGNILGIKFTAPSGEAYSFVDNVRVDWVIASSAYNPDPENGAEYVNRAVTLSWDPGVYTQDVNGHEVYFGTDFNSVRDANTSDSTGLYRGAYDVNYYDTNDYAPNGLDLGTTCHWRVDEVNGPDRYEGEVWSFTVEGLAKNIYPADGARDIPALYLVLRWEAGTGAEFHDVYLGTDKGAVEDANTSSDPNIYRVRQSLSDVNYVVLEALTVGQTYYWRIDEVNDTALKGHAWSFMTGPFLVVDSFEFYEDTAAIRAVWKDFWSDPPSENGADVFVETDPNFTRNSFQSMKYSFTNFDTVGGVGYVGSWAEADATALEFVTNDWTRGGVKAMVLYFIGDPCNSKDTYGVYQGVHQDQMWVALADGSTTEGVVEYPDMNDIKEDWWHEWNVSLQDFNAAGVVMTDVSKVYLGFGGPRIGQKKAGAGDEWGHPDTVYFDDIQLWPPRCMPELVDLRSAGDITDDCSTDYSDFEMMAGDWLMSDYATYGHTGYLKNYADDDSQWVETGKINGALKFDKAVKNIVEIPDANWSGLQHMSISAWVWPDGNQGSLTGIVYSREPDQGDASGLGYTTGKGWVANQELNYNWNNKTWSWHSEIFIPINKWSFIAMVVTPLEGKVYLHDGVSMSSASNAAGHAPLVQFNWDCDNSVGSDFFHRTFHGLIDDVRVYDYNLPESAVTNLALLGPDPNPGPKLWYKFDDGSGLIAADSGYSTDPVYHPVPSIANLVDPEVEYERFVNFRDYAIVADNWLKETLWPAP